MATNCIIPVIDLNDFSSQTCKLMEACQGWGCFRLINPDKFLPSILIKEMKSVVSSLFDLPVEIKCRNVDIIAGSGYMAPSAINPLYEALGVYDMDSHSGMETFCSQLNASPHQREIMTKYARGVHELLMRITEKLAEGLGIKSDKNGFENWICQFRINKYHFTPESIGSSGVQIHTDSGFLTVLQDDEDVGGLEVMDKSGHFIPVDPWPGTVVVNVGDMAKMWSNGRLHNVKHKVQCKEARIRFSIASFLLGPREAMETHPELVDAEHPRVYMPISYADYRKLRLTTDLHAGEALPLLHTLIICTIKIPSQLGS